MVQMPSGFAQNAVSAPAQRAAIAPAQDVIVSPSIVAAFKAFPKAGDELSARIADIIANDSTLAAGLVRYVQTEPSLTNDQKRAAERGLTEALTRLGIMAADMPVKAPPAPAAAPYDYSWLLALAALAGIICLGVCRHEHQVSPH